MNLLEPVIHRGFLLSLSHYDLNAHYYTYFNVPTHHLIFLKRKNNNYLTIFFFFLISGYVYMNGDIGKLLPGAVYPATPDQLGNSATTAAAASVVDYTVMNGGVVTQCGELMIESSSGAAVVVQEQQQTQSTTTGSGSGGGAHHAIGIAGGAIYNPIVDIANVQQQATDANNPLSQMADLSLSSIPLEQLKQMLSSQLEYYFSR